MVGLLKNIIPLVLLLIALLLPAEARQGCCSHHSGVCGCSCCDGTPLSAKCAPYYPNCNNDSKSYQINKPQEQNGLVKVFKFLGLMAAVYAGIIYIGKNR